MSEEEIKLYFKQLDEQRAKEEQEHDVFLQQQVPARLKIAMEGFNSAQDMIQIAHDLSIARMLPEDRNHFWERTKAFDSSSGRTNDDEHFIVFDFPIERGQIWGLAPADNLTMVSIFFAICSHAFLKINKGLFSLMDEEKEASAGLYKTAYDSIYYKRNIEFSHEEITQLKELWPLFKEEYAKNRSFAMGCRRVYFSMMRNPWEDALIDLTIAAEVLLMPESNERNKGRKIAKRLSRLLALSHQRSEVNNIMVAGYDLRNSIVHGEDTLQLELDGRDVVKSIRDYLKAALQIFLRNYKGISVVKLVDLIDHAS
jgi:hypothetical protein